MICIIKFCSNAYIPVLAVLSIFRIINIPVCIYLECILFFRRKTGSLDRHSVHLCRLGIILCGSFSIINPYGNLISAAGTIRYNIIISLCYCCESNCQSAVTMIRNTCDTGSIQRSDEINTVYI